MPRGCRDLPQGAGAAATSRGQVRPEPAPPNILSTLSLAFTVFQTACLKGGFLASVLNRYLAEGPA